MQAAQRHDSVFDARVEKCVDPHGFVVELLLFEQVTELLNEHLVFQAEAQGLLERETSLFEALFAEVETEDGIEGPNLWVQVV